MNTETTLANLPRIADARLPTTYQQAKAQLAKCVSVDECKDWADKAAALASYARQAEDEELETFARRIRLRALTRCGELLKEIEPKHTGRPSRNGAGSVPNSRKSAAATAGLSERQRKTALRLASVPKQKREELIESDKPPTVDELAKKGTKQKPRPLVDLKGRDPEEFKASTTAQGYVHRLAEVAASVDPAVVVRGAFDHEHPRLLDEAKAIGRWLARLIKKLEAKK
jgi:hypothetical protein